MITFKEPQEKWVPMRECSGWGTKEEDGRTVEVPCLGQKGREEAEKRGQECFKEDKLKEAQKGFLLCLQFCTLANVFQVRKASIIIEL